METLWKKVKEKFIRHAEWWNNYLTEMSVLIISLGATYYGDSLIESYMETQEDREAMGMIRTELASNLKELKDIDDYYLKEIRFSESFTSKLKMKKKIPADSLLEFSDQHRIYYYWFLKDNAFDMLRESGSMQRIDKALLTKLFECYEQLEVVKDMGVRYREERMLPFYRDSWIFRVLHAISFESIKVLRCANMQLGNFFAFFYLNIHSGIYSFRIRSRHTYDLNRAFFIG